MLAILHSYTTLLFNCVSPRGSDFAQWALATIDPDPARRERVVMPRQSRIEASDGLLLATVRERVASIVSRTTGLGSLRKRIDGLISRIQSVRNEVETVL